MNSGERPAAGRVEALARELACAIDDEASAERREALREMAIDVLQGDEAVPEAANDDRVAVAPAPAGNPFAMAIPLGLVGGVLLFLFPPVGLLLFAAAFATMIWGVVATLVTRGSAASR